MRTLGRRAVVLVVAPGLSFAGFRPAAPAPPEPVRVFVHATRAGDGLERAVVEVRERVRGRGARFRVADSAESADIVLRVADHRASVSTRRGVRGHLDIRHGPMWTDYDSAFVSHFVDAVATGGEAPRRLTGFAVGNIGSGALRDAASRLVEELERLCEERHCSP